MAARRGRSAQMKTAGLGGGGAGRCVESERFAGGWRQVQLKGVGRRTRRGLVDHRWNHGDGRRRSRWWRWRGRRLGQHHVAIANAAVPERDLGYMLALRRQQPLVRPAHDQGQGRIILPVSRFDEHCYLGM